MEISASLVKELRDRTGAGLMDCKSALKESGGDVDKAVSYIHPGSRIGVMVEVNCETDFVARTDEFQTFGRDIAMQIAATSPIGLDRDDVPADIVDKEREVYRTQAMEQKKPEKIIDKIVDGRMDKFYSESVLLDQPFIKDDSKTVRDLLNEVVSKLGENVKIARFARFQIGQ
jgi:elongation factor Ts